MTVAEVKYGMTYEEFCNWLLYFERRPPGWQADDRAFKVIQTQCVSSIKPWDVFPSLRAIYDVDKRPENLAKSLLNSPFMPHLLNAKGGSSVLNTSTDNR